MSEKPKRPPFQFHLSTGVVMMLVAAAFLFVSMKPRLTPNYGSMGRSWGYESYGWPADIVYRTVYFFDPDNQAWVPVESRLIEERSPWKLNLPGTAFDLSVLFAIAGFVEWLTRRQAREKCMST